MSLVTSFCAGLAVWFTAGSSFVAVDVIRAGDRVTPSNITTEAGDTAPQDTPIIGREVRRTVYQGQEVSMDNTREPRLVKRNQLVTVKYIDGGLEITTTGRAMGEAARDEAVTVMNLQSRKMVNGIVQEDGWVLAQ